MRPDKPIIQSRLDGDFYDITQGQVLFERYWDVPVELTFINRSRDIRLADIIDEVRLEEELRSYQTLEYTESELVYLEKILNKIHRNSRPNRDAKFIDFLRSLKKLPDFDVKVVDGQFKLKFFGPAAQVTHWEVPSMTIMKRLYREAFTRDFTAAGLETLENLGRRKLAEKIQILKEDPEITLADFCTRRRHSFQSQQQAIEILMKEIPNQLTGTSNKYFAYHFDIEPIGTISHKIHMILNGVHWISDNINPAFSQKEVLKVWGEIHGPESLIILPDTWNSDWYFENVPTVEQLRLCKASRQDSGVPQDYIRKRIRMYKELDIDPKTKVIVHADDLNAWKIRDISSFCRGEIKKTYGLGTNLGDDYDLPKPQIVTKVSRSAGHDIAKISDVESKASGTPEAIARIKRLMAMKLTQA